MGTSALVYVDQASKVVRVNYDGYPSHMIEALTAIVENGDVEAFTKNDEYRFISEAGDLSDTYNDQIRIRGTLNDDGTVTFAVSESYHYRITSDNEVIQL
jgi:hypothetical protein